MFRHVFLDLRVCVCVWIASCVCDANDWSRPCWIRVWWCLFCSFLFLFVWSYQCTYQRKSPRRPSGPSAYWWSCQWSPGSPSGRQIENFNNHVPSALNSYRITRAKFVTQSSSYQIFSKKKKWTINFAILWRPKGKHHKSFVVQPKCIVVAQTSSFRVWKFTRTTYCDKNCDRWLEKCGSACCTQCHDFMMEHPPNDFPFAVVCDFRQEWKEVLFVDQFATLWWQWSFRVVDPHHLLGCSVASLWTLSVLVMVSFCEMFLNSCANLRDTFSVTHPCSTWSVHVEQAMKTLLSCVP